MKKTILFFALLLVINGCKSDSGILSSDVRNKFEGTWGVTNNSYGGALDTFGIVKNPTVDNQVLLTNNTGSVFGNATVNGNTISYTDLPGLVHGVFYKGSGQISSDGKTINISGTGGSPGATQFPFESIWGRK